MTTELPKLESPLDGDDLASILRLCSPEGLLVGGQALAFWVDRLHVPIPAIFASGITTDADFIGNAQLAARLGRGLGWKTWVPSLDDATSQTAKVTFTERDGSVKQVDFLSGIAGLTTKDIRRRSAAIDVEGVGTVTVLHPIDVLDSRLQNLQLLPMKRTDAGFAQARLACQMVAAFIRAEVKTQGARAGLKLLERVVAIAEDYTGILVFVLYGIDSLSAVPLDAFEEVTELQQRRWPQMVAHIRAQRESLAKFANRVSDRALQAPVKGISGLATPHKAKSMPMPKPGLQRPPDLKAKPRVKSKAKAKAKVKAKTKAATKAQGEAGSESRPRTRPKHSPGSARRR